MTDGFKVAEVGDVEPGQMLMVEVKSEQILLANVDGEIFAVNGVCTHARCSLLGGSLEGNLVECPCHIAFFDVKTGAVISGPAMEAIESYPVHIDGKDVIVTME